MNNTDKIRNFLEKETQRVIETDDTDLIKLGVLDSFSMIKLISFIEDEFNLKVDMEELNPGNFNSVDTIVSMIKKWIPHIT